MASGEEACEKWISACSDDRHTEPNFFCAVSAAQKIILSFILFDLPKGHLAKPRLWPVVLREKNSHRWQRINGRIEARRGDPRPAQWPQEAVLGAKTVIGRGHTADDLSSFIFPNPWLVFLRKGISHHWQRINGRIEARRNRPASAPLKPRRIPRRSWPVPKSLQPPDGNAAGWRARPADLCRGRQVVRRPVCPFPIEARPWW